MSRYDRFPDPPPMPTVLTDQQQHIRVRIRRRGRRRGLLLLLVGLVLGAIPWLVHQWQEPWLYDTAMPVVLQEDGRTQQTTILRQASFANKRVERTEREFAEHATAFVSLIDTHPIALDLNKELESRQQIREMLNVLKKEGTWLIENYPKAQDALKRYREAVTEAVVNYRKASQVYAGYAEKAASAEDRSQYETMSQQSIDAAAFMEERAASLDDLDEKVAAHIKIVEESMLMFARIEHFLDFFPASADAEFLADYTHKLDLYIKRYREAMTLFRSFTDSLKAGEAVGEPAVADPAAVTTA